MSTRLDKLAAIILGSFLAFAALQAQAVGDKISFEMTVFGGPNSYEMAFEGTFDDEGLTGELLRSGGGSFATPTAARE